MIRLLKPFLLIGGLTILLLSSPSYGFGYQGHKLIAQLAQHQLTPHAKAQIKLLLGFEEIWKVAGWADKYRFKQSRDDLNYSGPWHYINLTSLAQLQSYQQDPVKDVYQALQKYLAILADNKATKPQRAQALKFVVHFVADAHQPLHVGKATDRGGNLLKLTFMGDNINLHALWDSGLLKQRKLANKAYLAHLTKLQSKHNTYGFTPMKNWFAESLQLREQVYDFGKFKSELGQEYFERNIDTLELQMVKAADRLAQTLNTALKK